MIVKSIKERTEGIEFKERVMDKLKNILGVKYIRFLSSASAAIHLIYKMFNKIAIQDQGIWKGYFDIANFYNVEVIKVKTNLGLIDMESLEYTFKKHRPEALIVQSMSGYIACQNMEEIYKICKEYNVMLINDISGSIFLKGLSTGDISDILICSTGKPKLLNIGFGGFIASNIDLSPYRNFLYAFKVPNIYYKYLDEEIKLGESRIKELIKYSKIFKEEIENCIHRDKIGICVGIKHENPKTILNKIKIRLDDGSSLITLCPNISRFLDNGFVVELKKIDVLNTDENIMYDIINIIKKIL